MYAHMHMWEGRKGKRREVRGEEGRGEERGG